MLIQQSHSGHFTWYIFPIERNVNPPPQKKKKPNEIKWFVVTGASRIFVFWDIYCMMFREISVTDRVIWGY